MPTSNTQRAQSAATDTPLGAPSGNEPYKTVRMKNMAQNDEQGVGTPGNSMYKTEAMGGNTQISSDITQETPKPAQGA